MSAPTVGKVAPPRPWPLPTPNGRNAAILGHTPGPWHWQHGCLRPVNAEPDSSAVHTILAPEMQSGGWGYLGSDWRETLKECDGNYRVIAAAPELLRALVAAEAFIGGFEDIGDESQGEINALLADIRAQIALAKGTA